ncbi:hypothetical protein JTE90_009645 [Oedothorax gibbosus]|uniref:Nephrin n=1 Tax=Oedothorax gibbosus TaxID=931172 RepID=A0AAV6VCP0_9ARAC|nr:hypothetical protein JTE90_009645 [Oedothorax gibbosus]
MLRGVEKSTTAGTTSELVVRADASDNGATYRCEAFNSALKKPLVANVTPAVLFPPASVSIKLKPRKPKAGDIVTLTCETASSNPESTVLWWKDGESISGHHEGVVNSSYGGKSTRNRVRFNVTSADDMSTYTCQATNHILRRTVHDSYVLRILYKPEFLLPPAERFDVMEGESTVVNATARANPSQVTYSWTRNGLPLLDATDSSGPGARFGHRAVFRGPLLELSDVTRDDGGEYGCEAANTEGVTWTSVNVNVIYPARITKLTRTTVVGHGETASFECLAIANPFVSRMLEWRRPGFDMSRTRETVEKGRSKLDVLNVSRADAGTFECVAFNGVGEETSQSAQLIVKFKPEVRLPHGFSDVAGAEGEGARLVCLAEGAPAITFAWSFAGAVLGATSSSKYASQAAQLDAVTWESVLFVKHLQPGDFGMYTCVARNELGHDHVKVRLRRRGELCDADVLTKSFCSSNHLRVVLRWRCSGRASSSKYASQAYQDSVTWEIVLFVKHLQPGDFGMYTCVARNELGHDHVVKVRLRRRGPPDPPYNIRIVNTSSDSIVLSWTPGYSSGLPQQFRVRHHPTSGQPGPRYTDVFPTNSTVFAVAGLEPETEYSFALSARNMLGESLYSKENTRAITQKRKPGTGSNRDALSEGGSEEGERLPRFLLAGVCAVGALLLLLNVVLVACFLKRRKARNAGGSPKGLTQTTTPDSLMYTPSKYQQTINGEAICQMDDKDATYQEEILMKELYEAKKQVSDKCLPGYQTASPYDLTQARKKDNCPDILKNRGMDHVSLQSVPLSDITTLSSEDNSRYSRRGILLPPEENISPHHPRTRTPPTQDSCVLGTVGTHLV